MLDRSQRFLVDEQDLWDVVCMAWTCVVDITIQQSIPNEAHSRGWRISTETSSKVLV